jgi:MinD-like ATPase involved in chromosome partitioning or flagellar assembly
MDRKKRLGRGLEDISHLFLSPVKPVESEPSQPEKKQACRTGGPAIAARSSRPRVIAVVGRTPGVSSIFWAGHVASALSRCGKKTLVMDVGTKREELVLVLKSMAIHPTLGDLLNQSDKSIAIEGPLGFRILTFQLQLGELREFKEEEREILFQILREEEQLADVLLLNISLDLNQSDALSYLRCLQEAVLVVSAQDLPEAYRTLKILFHVRPSLRVGLIEYARSDSYPQGGLQKLVLACGEFLRQSPMVLGRIPPDSSMMRSVMTKTLLELSDNPGPAGQALLEIGQNILNGLNGREHRPLFFDEIQTQLDDRS